MSEENKTEVKMPDPLKLIVSSSPHLHGGESVRKVMVLVVIALLPACFMGIYHFGLNAIRVLVICCLACLAFEYICGRILGRPDAWKDGSALVTGLLLGMILSAAVPWWVCVVGAFLAIVLAKQMYGGLGFNPFNPACIARIGLTIGFPKIMTTWVPSLHMGKNSEFLTSQAKELMASGKCPTFVNSVIDGVTCATPLGVVTVSEELGTATESKFAQLADSSHLWDYAIGNMGGCLGETSAIALLLGGVLLIWWRLIKWQLPAAYIGTVLVLGTIIHCVAGHSAVPGAAFQVLTGGLMIGAFFMATDMVTSPMTVKGGVIFGIGCGILTCLIRDFGSYPEGVMFSIVLMNALTPLIDRFTRKKPFGFQSPEQAGDAK